MESENCKHCGACRCHDRCSCCGHCRNCGQFIALPFAWPCPIPYPYTPYTVPYTVPWMPTTNPFVPMSGSATGYPSSVRLGQPQVSASSTSVFDPNMQTTYTNGVSVSLIQ